MAETPDRPGPRQDSSREKHGWGALSTEARNPASEHLDKLRTEDVAVLLLDEDLHGLEAARRCSQGIAQAATWVAETLSAGGVLLFAGAGTSGRLGILEAAECPPTFGTDPEQIRAVIAGGPEAVFAAREGAEDVSSDGAAAGEELGAGDLLIAISASSVTPFAHGALASARENGARTILVTCTAPGEVGAAVANLVLALDTGPEVVTGSTRLKAGSATKAVLNAITTAAMVRLGKVYGNLMVDLRAGSAKLRDRALRIIEAAGEVSHREAERLYDEAEGEVKTAIVMALCTLGPNDARERLRAVEGHVRKALAERSAVEDGISEDCEE
jgi:N-acetylmuramic acid 6-phosphate etherase